MFLITLSFQKSFQRKSNYLSFLKAKYQYLLVHIALQLIPVGKTCLNAWQKVEVYRSPEVCQRIVFQ